MRKFEFVKDEYLNGTIKYMSSGERLIIPTIYLFKKLPTRSTENSAGYDFYAPFTFSVKAHEKVMFSTNVKVKMNPDEVLLIVPRSSVGMKKGCMLTNTVGVIDSDFYSNQENDGNIAVELYNFSDRDASFERGERICQGIFVKYFTVENEEEVTEKRKGGIGSTN